MCPLFHIGHMENEGKLTAHVSFRAAGRMVDDIEAYRKARRLPKGSDAARELMQHALAEPELVNAATEFRRLGGDPVAALRAAIAELDHARQLQEIGGKVGIIAPHLSP